MAVLALTIGTTGVAVAQAEATEDTSPAAVSESSTTSFPTVYFVSVETGRVMLEFHGDGTGMTHSASLDSIAPFTFAVDGEVYTALRGGGATIYGMALAEVEQPRSPATYRWDYDGERMAFELIGEDTADHRKSLMAGNTFRPIEDPRVVLVATSDLDVGDPIRALRGYAPAAEAGPDAYTSKTEYLGHVAAVPISKGQPITPDLVEPKRE